MGFNDSNYCKENEIIYYRTSIRQCMVIEECSFLWLVKGFSYFPIKILEIEHDRKKPNSQEFLFLGLPNQSEHQTCSVPCSWPCHILRNLFIVILIHLDSCLHTTIYLFPASCLFLTSVFPLSQCPNCYRKSRVKFHPLPLKTARFKCTSSCFLETSRSSLLVAMAYDHSVTICFPLHCCHEPWACSLPGGAVVGADRGPFHVAHSAPGQIIFLFRQHDPTLFLWHLCFAEAGLLWHSCQWVDDIYHGRTHYFHPIPTDHPVLCVNFLLCIFKVPPSCGAHKAFSSVGPTSLWCHYSMGPLLVNIYVHQLTNLLWLWCGNSHAEPLHLQSEEQTHEGSPEKSLL